MTQSWSTSRRDPDRGVAEYRRGVMFAAARRVDVGGDAHVWAVKFYATRQDLLGRRSVAEATWAPAENRPPWMLPATRTIAAIWNDITEIRGAA